MNQSKDEISVFDETRQQTKTIYVSPAPAARIRVSNSKKTGTAKELEALIQGDVAETEVARDLAQAKSQASAMPSEEKHYDYALMAREVLTKSKITIQSQPILKRLEIVLQSFIKKVRRVEEIREILMKKMEQGGLSFDANKTDKLIKAMESLAPKEFEAEKPEEVPTLQASTVFTQKVKPIIEKVKEKAPEETAPTEAKAPKKKSKVKQFFSKLMEHIRIPVKSEEAQIKEAMKGHSKEESPSVLKPSIPVDELVKLEKEVKEDIIKTAREEKQGIFTPPPAGIEAAPIMAIPEAKDVLSAKDAVIPIGKPKEESPLKGMGTLPSQHGIPDSSAIGGLSGMTPSGQAPITASRLVGPVDELRYTLDDFRRLGKNPQDRVAKILQKLKLLEEESFTNKFLGIKAWMGSDVFKKYINIGEKCLDRRVNVDESIDSMLAAGETALTREEWEAVAQLNTEMRV